MIRYLEILCAMLLWGISSFSQTLTVDVPSKVSKGENFKLIYTIDTQTATDFRVGNIPDALEVITGPYTSSQVSYQVVNGHANSTASITYTFILCASKTGTFTIPAAGVTVSGKRISSRAAKVTVSGESQSKNGAPKMHGEENDAPSLRDAGTPISGSDLFIKVSANKQRVHEQEPILLTYKVYTLVDLTQLEGKMPDLNGFHIQEIPMPQQKSFHVETVNGRSYRCVTWSQYVLYPQMTGKLEIPSITFTGTVVQVNRNIDPYEAIFNGGSGYIEVKRDIKAPGLTVQVDSLPKRPQNFSGGVGKFNISAQTDRTQLKANEPLNIRVIIGGTGNLKLIKEPKIEFPKDFEKYDAKVTDKTTLSTSGLEGNMVYDFLAVPRSPGKYVIPAIEFTYYDTGENRYKTIKTKDFEIDVSKGSGNHQNIDYGDSKIQDIHSIKTGVAKTQNIDNIFYASVVYWILLSVLFATFIALLIIFRKRAINNADIVRVKGKKANRVATKRLKYAQKLMLLSKHDEFYDEVLRALWGYVSDKLNIAVAQLDKENISEKLSLSDVDPGTISMFMEALDECEYNRYAPGDPVGNMNQTFDAAMTAIIKIEDTLKTKKKRSSSIKSITILVMLFVAIPSSAITKQNADDEYRKGNYQQAIIDYEELLKKGPSASVYYNLGNAYYRSEDITHAVLNYERALLLSPGDEDIRFNLEMARSKTIDKIAPKPRMFFISWYYSLVNLAGVDTWARVGVISIALALILVLFYLFASRMFLRKLGFYGAIILIVIFLLSNIFAYEQKVKLTHRSGAIVMTPSVTLKKTPVSTGEDALIIHEGSRVDIIDDSMKDWKLVKLLDGRQGWIKTSEIERI